MPTDTGGGVTGYRIERSPDELARAWTGVVADTGAAALSWGDSDVAADTVYVYRVSALNSAGVGTPSGEATGRSRPQLTLGGLLPYPLTAHAEPRVDAAVTATFAAYLPGRSYDLDGQLSSPAGWWRVLLFGPGGPGPYWLPALAGTVLGTTTNLPQPPAAPESFTATLVSGESALSWSAPLSGATVTGYRLWRQVDENAWTVREDSLLATALSHTDPGLSVDQVYRYRVQALSDEGPGVFTAVQALAVMTAPAVPDPVTGLTVAATGYSLQLGWTRGATGGLPTAYRVGWAPAGTTPLEETTIIGTTHELTDLVPNTAYDLQVTAFNQEGAAAATAGTGTTLQVTPGDPVALTVTVQGQDAVVNWRASVAGGRPDSYELQHRLPMDSWPTTATAVAAVAHTLPGLGYEQDLEVRVRAVNTAGQSAWVEVAFTTGREPMVPDVPAGLRAQPSADSQMQLRWTAEPTGGVATGYRIERSADVSPRDWQEAVDDTGSTATTWADRGLDASTIYHYRVTGFNAEGVGAESAEATGTTRPQLTLNATAPYPLAHQWPAAPAPATHTWAAHEATVHDVAAQGPGGGWWRVVRFGQGTSGPYWIPAGAGTVSGTTSTLPAAAGLPGDLMATATHASVSLSWRAPLSGGTVTGYRVWRQTGEEAYAGLGGDLAATALTHTDTSVTGSTAYQYRLQAPADPGSQPLSGYRIERAVAAPPRVWTEVVADTGNLDLIWDDSGLDASTVYHYRVSARNRVGAGAASGEAMGTTRPQLVLRANASYPLTAHAWPAATAPVTHSWSAPETTVFDLVGQGSGWGRLVATAALRAGGQRPLLGNGGGRDHHGNNPGAAPCPRAAR